MQEPVAGEVGGLDALAFDLTEATTAVRRVSRRAVRARLDQQALAGAQVEVRRVPVTISHAACDLTGVAISYRNRGGATVPRNGGGTGIGNSDGFELTVHPGSLDVTITVTGPHGNA
jgi:hypothetical protein